MGIQTSLLAIVVAAFATFAFGALWYSPLLFGRLWVKAHGYTPEKLVEMRAGAARAYAVSLLCYGVIALALAVLIDRLGIAGARSAVKLGVLCWAGFAATLGLTAQMFSDKRFATYLIDAGYQLLAIVGMSLLLTLWR
jgi:hypothetical protein